MPNFFVEITVDDVAALPCSTPGMFALCVPLASGEAILPDGRYWIIRDGRRIFVAGATIVSGDRIEARVRAAWGDYEHVWWPDNPTDDLA
jgi:hypothetical protein